MNGRHTENLILKASRLVGEERCYQIAADADRYWFGVVDGDHGRYLTAYVNHDALPSLGTGLVPPQTSCTCPSGNLGRTCSHVLAAQQMVPVGDAFAGLW